MYLFIIIISFICMCAYIYIYVYIFIFIYRERDIHVLDSGRALEPAAGLVTVGSDLGRIRSVGIGTRRCDPDLSFLVKLFLIEMPKRGFPCHMNLFETCMITKRNPCLFTFQSSLDWDPSTEVSSRRHMHQGLSAAALSRIVCGRVPCPPLPAA